MKYLYHTFTSHFIRLQVLFLQLFSNAQENIVLKIFEVSNIERKRNYLNHIFIMKRCAKTIMKNLLSLKLVSKFFNRCIKKKA